MFTIKSIIKYYNAISAFMFFNVIYEFLLANIAHPAFFSIIYNCIFIPAQYSKIFVIKLSVYIYGLILCQALIKQFLLAGIILNHQTMHQVWI